MSIANIPEKATLTTCAPSIPSWVVKLHEAVLDGESHYYDATDQEACAIFVMARIPEQQWWQLALYPSIRDAQAVTLVYSRKKQEAIHE